MDVGPSVGENNLCDRLVITPVTQLQFLVHRQMITSENNQKKPQNILKLRLFLSWGGLGPKEGTETKNSSCCSQARDWIYPTESAHPTWLWQLAEKLQVLPAQGSRNFVVCYTQWHKRQKIYFQSSYLLDNKHILKDRSPKSQDPRKEVVYSLQYFISKLFPTLVSTSPTAQR